MQTISSQHYLDDATVADKRAARDYVVSVSPVFEHDGEALRVVLDGHHSLAAAKADGVEPAYVEADAQTNDRVSLLARGEIEDFLAASTMDGDWYNIETGAYPW